MSDKVESETYMFRSYLKWELHFASFVGIVSEVPLRQRLVYVTMVCKFPRQSDNYRFLTCSRYTIRRYSQWFNEVSERHHMMLTLERVSDQQPIEDVLNIPRPSELDDWDLYQKYESELIKQKRGSKAFLD